MCEFKITIITILIIIVLYYYIFLSLNFLREYKIKCEIIFEKKREKYLPHRSEKG